jgi:hypothetical protein
MEIENKTLEILDLVREKVLSPDEALPHILRLFSVVGRSEQLSCSTCKWLKREDGYCDTCFKFCKHEKAT